MTLKEEVLQILRLLALRVKFFWITPWRYPLDTLGFYIFTLMLFSGLILGVTRFAPIQEIEEAKGAVLISYVFWLFYVMSAHSTSISIASLASSGTLERHLITSMGHLKVVLIWLIARYIAYVPQYIVIIVILTLIFRVQIFFSFGIVIAVVAVFLVSFLFFIGLALIFTGLALVFKQVTSVIGLFQFIFFTFSLAANDPSGSWLDQVFQWFPYTQIGRAHV